MYYITNLYILATSNRFKKPRISLVLNALQLGQHGYRMAANSKQGRRENY
jgi:hypothetical protein